MISAQCDELRAMAASVGLEVPQAATLMMGAADAIDRLDAENAKLREEFNKMDVWHSKELTAAMAENAKLRELLQRTWDAFHDATAREFVTVKNELRELGVME